MDLKSIESQNLSDRAMFVCKIKGKSMYPFLKEGDEGLFIARKSGEFKRGEIAAFRKRNKIIVHRILFLVPLFDNNFIAMTKGDNKLYPDPWLIQKKDILGVLAKVIKEKKGGDNIGERERFNERI